MTSYTSSILSRLRARLALNLVPEPRIPDHIKLIAKQRFNITINQGDNEHEETNHLNSTNDSSGMQCRNKNRLSR